MSCTDIEAAIPVYLDGELDPAATLEVERHLRGCERCAAVAGHEQELRLAYRDRSLRFEAPEELATRVRRALAARAGAERARGFQPRQRLAIAASFVLAVAVTALVTRLALAPSGEPALLGPGAVEPRALVDVRPTDRGGVVGPAHGQAVVRGEARLLAAGDGPRGGGVPAGRRPRRRAGRASGRRAGLSPAPARHQRVRLAGGSGTEPSPGRSDKNGYHMVAWSRSGMTYRGDLRRRGRRAGPVRGAPRRPRLARGVRPIDRSGF